MIMLLNFVEYPRKIILEMVFMVLFMWIYLKQKQSKYQLLFMTTYVNTIKKLKITEVLGCFLDKYLNNKKTQISIYY